jgi:two-component system nitrate/nitrite response regulator NarL
MSPTVCMPDVGVMPMRILVADSQSKVRHALCVLLRQQPGLEIVGEAASALELLTQTEECCPNLILLHWRLRDLTASDLLPALRKKCPGFRLIVLSARREACQAALDAGADAFVCKMDPPDRLLAAVQAIQQAEVACVTG